MDRLVSEQEIIDYLREIERWTGKTVTQQVYEALTDYIKKMVKTINKDKEQECIAHE